MRVHKSTYWFITVFLLIIIIGITSYYSLNNVKENEKAVTHTYDVIAELKQLQINFVSSESAARAFMLSAHTMHLTSYEANTIYTLKEINTIRNLTADNPVQQKNIIVLKEVVEKRLSDLNLKIDRRKKLGLDDFILKGTKTGSDLMKSVELVSNAMENEELRLLNIRSLRAKKSRQISDLIIITGTLLNLIFVLYLIRMIRNAFRKRKQVQIELSENNTKLDELNKQKNYMLGMAAHDLRNPAAAINMMCDFLLPDVEQKQEKDTYEFLKNIQTSSAYMLQLLDDILDLAKIEAGKVTLNVSAVHITDFLKRIWELNSLQANKKNIYIRLDNKVPASTVVHIDAIKIEQVLNNLITNAIKFSPGQSEIILHSKIENESLIISVKDQGQGIPSHEQQKLFKAFQKISVQSTSGERSTGLGLAISANIMNEHGGKIEVISETNKGSNFFITLPLN